MKNLKLYERLGWFEMQMQHVLFPKCINNVKFSWLHPQFWSVQLCNGFTLCYGFICYIYFNHKVAVNVDFNFYYPIVNKDIIIIEAHFYNLNCCFFLDNLTFYSIQNPKTNLCFQHCIPQSYCMPRDIWGPIKKLSNIMNSF